MEVADYQAMSALHQESAALSSRGRQRIVPDTHHNIQIDRPEAVVEAIREVLRELK
jgi:pimeloyl-ACP methyl ester carboxylesterase